MTAEQYQGQAARVAAEPRYGQWRRPRSAGLLGLGTVPTIGAFAWIVVSFLVMMIQLPLGWLILGVGLLVLGPLTLRVGDRNLYQLLVARLSYARGRRRGQHQLLNGPLGVMPGGSHRLPGLLAATKVHHARDAYGREFGLIEHVGTGTYSAVLRTDAEGDQLVDREQVDDWVAGWGQWLARLGQLPGLDGAQVTVETAPDSGQRLHAEVARLTAADGPNLAQQVLDETAVDYPASSAAVSTRIAITWRAHVSAAAAKARSTEEMAVEIGTRLPAIGRDLAITGAGSARPMTVEQLSETVFAAYNPAETAEVDHGRASQHGTGITWDNCGPNGTAIEQRGRYTHGSGYSIVSVMEEAPRGAVLSNVLRGLLEPNDDFDRKRIMLHYSPHDPGEAAQLVERDLKHARTLASKRKVAHARDDADVRAAEQSTDEEASGAGLVSFGLVATATVLDADRLRQASATLANDAAASRLRLRRCYGSQSAAFAVGLGLGLRPERLATLGDMFSNR